ncbi:MAG: extracellular solute-binding protein [Firmicutes bacterium]|nr:extracellular solute-binding protein [Bacillota bacterium]
MKKSILSILLLITIFITSCNIETNSKYKEYKEEISIFCIDSDEGQLNTFISQKVLFEQKYNIKVKLESVEVKNDEEYNEVLSLMMNKTKGPTLIFISLGSNYQRFLDTDVAVKLTGKIPNRKNLIDTLKTDEYFLPLGIYYPALSIDRKILKEIDAKSPTFDWTREDYKNLREASLERESKQLNIWSYNEIYNMIFKEIDLINEKKKSAEINTREVKKALEEIKKEVYSGRYILPPDYGYENFRNMLLDNNSDEYKQARKIYLNESKEKLINTTLVNALKPTSNNSITLARDKIILPDIPNGNGKLLVSGFILNRNGKNKELGLKFLNYLLNKESQRAILRTQGSFIHQRNKYLYPSIKGVEDEMKEIEKENYTHQDFIDLREYTFNKLKKGMYKIGNNISKQQASILRDLKEISIDYVFRKKSFTEEELTHILKRKEDKYNIWLNE